MRPTCVVMSPSLLDGHLRLAHDAGYLAVYEFFRSIRLKSSTFSFYSGERGSMNSDFIPTLSTMTRSNSPSRFPTINSPRAPRVTPPRAPPLAFAHANARQSPASRP